MTLTSADVICHSSLRVLHYLVYKITAHDALLEDP